MKGLCELDESLGDLKNLELLSLSDNKIKRLPKGIGKLKNLDFLNIKKNPLEDIPEEIGDISVDEVVALSAVMIKYLPKYLNAVKYPLKVLSFLEVA